MAESPARWAISPTDGKTHSLLPVVDHPPEGLQAQCGHWLPWSAVAHDHLLGWRWCVPSMVAHLVPAPVFPRKLPAGCQLSETPGSAPGGQPVPDPPVTDAAMLDRGHPIVGDPPPSGCADPIFLLHGQPTPASLSLNQHLLEAT